MADLHGKNNVAFLWIVFRGIKTYFWKIIHENSMLLLFILFTLLAESMSVFAKLLYV